MLLPHHSNPCIEIKITNEEGNIYYIELTPDTDFWKEHDKYFQGNFTKLLLNNFPMLIFFEQLVISFFQCVLLIFSHILYIHYFYKELMHLNYVYLLN